MPLFSVSSPVRHITHGWRFGDLVIHDIMKFPKSKSQANAAYFKSKKGKAVIPSRWGFAHFHTGTSLVFLAPWFFEPVRYENARAPHLSRIKRQTELFAELTAEAWVFDPAAIAGELPPAFHTHEDALYKTAQIVFRRA